MQMYKILIENNPSTEDTNIIKEGLLHNTAQILGDQGWEEQDISFFLKDETGALLGGIIASMDSESIYINQLWIEESLRRQDYGSELLKTAEDEALKCGCTYATLDTWSFQAESFYLKNGYHRIGEIKNYFYEHSKIFLRKKLK
jgi:GNAT superfamily N-acetyltransferase